MSKRIVCQILTKVKIGTFFFRFLCSFFVFLLKIIKFARNISILNSDNLRFKKIYDYDTSP